MTESLLPRTQPSRTTPSAAQRLDSVTRPSRLHVPIKGVAPAQTVPIRSQRVFEYRFHPLSWRDVLSFVLMALIVIGLGGYGFWLYYTDYTQHGIAVATTRSQTWFSAAFIVGLVALPIVFMRLRTAAYRITQAQDGIVLTRLFLPTRRLNWEDITGIATGVTAETLFGRVIHTRMQTVLHLSNGQRVLLDSRLPQLAELTTRLKASLYRRAYPRLRTDFLDGYPVSFGPLTLQRTFIAIGGRKIPWREVQHMTIEAGWLVIQLTQGKTVRFPTAKIPNIELVFRLVSEGVRP